MRFLKEFSSYNITFIITILGIKLYEITNLLYVINIKQIRSLKPFCCIINATMIKKINTVMFKCSRTWTCELSTCTYVLYIFIFIDRFWWELCNAIYDRSNKSQFLNRLEIECENWFGKRLLIGK